MLAFRNFFHRILLTSLFFHVSFFISLSFSTSVMNSRLDDAIERDVLPVRRSYGGFKAPHPNHILSLPLSAIARIVAFSIGYAQGEEMERRERRVASVCLVFSWAVRDVRGTRSVHENYEKLSDSVGKLKVILRALLSYFHCLLLPNHQFVFYLHSHILSFP